MRVSLASVPTTFKTHGDLDTRVVRVVLDGTVRISGRRSEAPGSAGPPDARRADVRAAAGIVAEIAKAAGRPARPAGATAA